MDGHHNGCTASLRRKAQLAATAIVVGSIALHELDAASDSLALHVHPAEYYSHGEEQLAMLKVAPTGSSVVNMFDYSS